MQDAVLSFWREGGLPGFVDLQPGRFAISLMPSGADVTPGPPPGGVGVHVADLTYADDICRLTLLGTHKYALLDCAETSGASPGKREIVKAETLRLENGDTLRIDAVSFRFIQSSRYLRYLPAPFHAPSSAPDIPPQFAGRFLMVFEHILNPLSTMIGQIDGYIHPRTAPASLLPYLASWFDLDTAVMPAPARQRDLLHHAIEINRWRSTPHGLILHIQACTGCTPEIIEWYTDADGSPALIAGAFPDWMEQRPAGSMPPNARTGCFSIVLPVDDTGQDDIALIEIVDAIAQLHRPVHSAYEIWLTSRDGRVRLVSNERG